MDFSKFMDASRDEKTSFFLTTTADSYYGQMLVVEEMYKIYRDKYGALLFYQCY